MSLLIGTTPELVVERVLRDIEARTRPARCGAAYADTHLQAGAASCHSKTSAGHRCLARKENMNSDHIARQRCFEFVANHLLHQNARAVRMIQEEDDDDPVEHCCYRVGDCNGELRCAIGALMRDDLYDPCIEGRGPNDGEVKTILVESGVPVNTIGVRFLKELQGIHDGWQPTNWPRQLESFARDHDLTFDAIEFKKEHGIP